MKKTKNNTETYNKIEEIEGEKLMQLEYYKIYSQNENKSGKPYGVGITKTYFNDIEKNIEKREFNNIFTKENEADNMLEILIKNKVTPVSLRDILEDFVLV